MEIFDTKEMQIFSLDYNLWETKHYGCATKKITKYLSKPKSMCSLLLQQWKFGSLLHRLQFIKRPSSFLKLVETLTEVALKLYVHCYATSTKRIKMMSSNSMPLLLFFGQSGMKETTESWRRPKEAQSTGGRIQQCWLIFGPADTNPIKFTFLILCPLTSRDC